MKWAVAGASCFFLTLLIAIFSHSTSTLWWLILGLTMGLGLFTALVSYLKLQEKRPSAPKTDLTIVQHLEAKLAEQHKMLSAQVEDTGRKLLKTQEKFAAAQKLVAVHAAEIDSLRKEKLAFSEEILLKTRRIAELELYLEDPKSVAPDDNEYAFLYEQAKKQIAALEQEKTTIESTLAQKLTHILEEKSQLESQLALVQEKVIPKKSSSSTKKKATATKSRK